MATVEKIEQDIAKTKAKISELQSKVKKLEAQKKDAENMQIVSLVKAVKMDTPHLTAILKAYAKGDIELPAEYAEELIDTDETAYTETEDGEDEE